MNNPDRATTVRLNAMTAAAIMACVVSIVGVLLPWGTLTILVPVTWEPSILAEVSGDLSYVGTDAVDGKVVLGYAFAALVVIVAFSLSRKRWLAIVALLLGAVIAATGIYDTIDIERHALELTEGLLPTHTSVGAGLYVVILGGLALVAAATTLTVTTRRTPRHSEPPDPDPPPETTPPPAAPAP